jgi:hypothetical protein
VSVLSKAPPVFTPVAEVLTAVEIAACPGSVAYSLRPV